MTELNATQIALKAIDIFAATHPRPPHVNQSQAAEMLRCSRDTVRNLLKAGTLTLNDCGLIPITDIDRAIAARGG